MKLPESKLIKNQEIKKHAEYTEDGIKCRITAAIRHDDQCGNGHNSFSITGDIHEYRNGRWIDAGGGCIHDEIAKHFPELKPFIKWHLTSTDEPMHYVANTLYHASDKDCWGFRAGEPRRFVDRLYFKCKIAGKDITFPIQIKLDNNFLGWLKGLENYDLEVMAVHHKPGDYDFKPKYTFVGYEMDTWHKAPFDTEREALEFLEALNVFDFDIKRVPTDVGEGSTPDLDAARRCAVWPEANLEDFTKEALEARLPSLMREFKRDVESLGLEY